MVYLLHFFILIETNIQNHAIKIIKRSGCSNTCSYILASEIRFPDGERVLRGDLNKNICLEVL
jgi:hypothetical protein